MYNPFSSKEDPAPPYSASQVPQKPSLDAQPNVQTPPGGYGNPAKEAEFASKQGKELQVQAGLTVTGGAPADTNRIAMASAETPAAYGPYSDPNLMTPGSYAPASIQQPSYPPSYQMPTNNPNPADYAPSNGPGFPAAQPTSNYSPFPQTTPGYEVPQQPQGFGQPAAPAYDPQQLQQQNYGAPQQNYGAPANYGNYNAPPSYGSGYTATPSTTGGF
jgi:hypothetical protein